MLVVCKWILNCGDSADPESFSVQCDLMKMGLCWMHLKPFLMVDTRVPEQQHSSRFPPAPLRNSSILCKAAFKLIFQFVLQLHSLRLWSSELSPSLHILLPRKLFSLQNSEVNLFSQNFYPWKLFFQLCAECIICVAQSIPSYRWRRRLNASFVHQTEEKDLQLLSLKKTQCAKIKQLLWRRWVQVHRSVFKTTAGESSQDLPMKATHTLDCCHGYRA